MNAELLQIAIQNFIYRLIPRYYIIGIFKEFEFAENGKIDMVEKELFVIEKKMDDGFYHALFTECKEEEPSTFTKIAVKKLIKEFKNIGIEARLLKK